MHVNQVSNAIALPLDIMPLPNQAYTRPTPEITKSFPTFI
jgi:hypothetical protein